MSFGYTKQQRLLSSHDFSKVFNQSTWRASTRELLLLAIINDQGTARLGLVMSRKNVGCAVARNRLKRLSRETFRQHGPGLANLDIVVLARAGIARLDNKTYSAMFSDLLHQLNARQAGASP